MALVSFGLTAKNEISGFGLITSGFLWPLWAGWVSPYSSIGLTLVSTTWAIYGMTASTTWTVMGMTATTTWTALGMTATTSWTSLGMTAPTGWTLYDTIPSGF